MRRWFIPGLLAAVALFYVLTLRHGHAWHDDFALYVLHARNLALGIPYEATGFVYNPAAPWHSPAVYPPGFPLLLAPFYALVGADLFLLKLVVVASFVAALGVFSLLIRPLLPARFFFLAMVLVALQPFFARFKNLLLPDYTFMLLAFTSLYLLRRLYERDDDRRTALAIGVLAGVCMAGAVSVRMVGVALFAALVLYQALQFRLPRLPVLVAGIVAATLFALQLALMPAQSGYAAQQADVANIIQVPPPFYALMIWRVKTLFMSMGVLWAPRDDLGVGVLNPVELVVMLALIPLTWVLAFLGLSLRLRRTSVIETFVIAYVAVLLYWGFTSSRYVVPLLPFMLFYAVEGVRFLLVRGNRGVQYGLMSLGVAVAGAYLINLAQVRRTTFAGDVTDSQATELFAYLRECEAGVRFVSDRPRAVALFTGHEATTAGTAQHEPDRFADFTERMSVDYVVTFRGSRLDSATVALPGLTTTFENARFVVRAIPFANTEHGCPAS